MYKNQAKFLIYSLSIVLGYGININAMETNYNFSDLNNRNLLYSNTALPNNSDDNKISINQYIMNTNEINDMIYSMRTNYIKNQDFTNQQKAFIKSLGYQTKQQILSRTIKSKTLILKYGTKKILIH